MVQDPVLGMRRGAELEAGSDAHYEDAAYYAATYADRNEDIDYYVGLCVDQAAEVLEYGCGSGRIALPLARAGLQVTGVDRSVVMLTELRRKLALEPHLARRMTVKRGDMRRLRLNRRWPLVLCTFNTWLHLYTRHEIERYCARVLEHLKPRGRFIVDVSIPDPEELSRDPNRAYRTPRFRHPSSGEVVRYAERFDYDSLAQIMRVSMEFEPRDRPEQAWMTPLTQRQFFPREMEALLHYNGLEVVALHGDFESEPPDVQSTSLIYHCRRRKGW